jgi:hypothetical protein
MSGFCEETMQADEAKSTDTLLELQLRVARRADELARDCATMAGLNLHCWLSAEREICGENADQLALRPVVVAAGG